MNHRGLIVALALAAIVGAVFGFFPQLDLMIAAPFHAIVLDGNNFGLRVYPPLMFARNVGLWVGALLILPAIAALVSSATAAWSNGSRANSRVNSIRDCRSVGFFTERRRSLNSRSTCSAELLASFKGSASDISRDYLRLPS